MPIYFAWFAVIPHLTLAQRPPVLPVDLRYFRVDFIIPGARPSSLGGAFIGAALDETASPINPAGLTYLTRPGASMHQRQSFFSFDEPEGQPDNLNRKKSFDSSIFNQNMVNLVFPCNNWKSG